MELIGTHHNYTFNSKFMHGNGIEVAQENTPADWLKIVFLELDRNIGKFSASNVWLFCLHSLLNYRTEDIINTNFW